MGIFLLSLISSFVAFPLHLQIPETIDDSDFEGTEPDVLCNEHSLPAERRVAFQGIHTGRRFFACAVKVCAKFMLIWSLFSADFIVSRSGVLVAQ